jgi:CRP-like cAMP-binding protein
LRNTDQHIAEITLLDLPARLASSLLRLAEQGEPTKRQVKVSQRQLGQLVGASRESVNKCLSEWQRGGIVQTRGSVITVANHRALEQIAQPD